MNDKLDYKFMKLTLRIRVQLKSAGNGLLPIVRQATTWILNGLNDSNLTLILVVADTYLAPSHYAKQWWPSVIRPEWVNTLWPRDAIWRHGSGSTLAQVMACCLTAPSHYLNQCWLVISKVWRPSSECNFTTDTTVIITKISLIIRCMYLKFCSNLPRANELKWTYILLPEDDVPTLHLLSPETPGKLQIKTHVHFTCCEYHVTHSWRI